MDRKKTREVVTVERVAAVRGGTARPHAGDWPDVWLACSDGSIPVEVVAAIERPYDELPTEGAAVKRAAANAQREADRRIAAGEHVAHGAHAVGSRSARGYVVSLDKPERLPLPMNPANPIRWITLAVQQKLAKSYDQMGDAILVVDYEWPPVENREVHDIGRALEMMRCGFREVWVVSEYMSPRAVRRVPY